MASHPLVRVGLGTCGIAAGGDKVWAVLDQEIRSRELDVNMVSTGCIGMCFAEPLVEVCLPGQPRIIYGNVTPEIAAAIVRLHLQGGSLLRNNVIAQDPGDLTPFPEIPLLNETPF